MYYNILFPANILDRENRGERLSFSIYPILFLFFLLPSVSFYLIYFSFFSVYKEKIGSVLMTRDAKDITTQVYSTNKKYKKNERKSEWKNGQIGSCQFYATTTKKTAVLFTRLYWWAIFLSHLLYWFLFIHFPSRNFLLHPVIPNIFFFFLSFFFFLCLEVNNNPWSASSSFNGSSSFAIETRHTISILSRPWFFFFIASFRHHLGKVPMIMNFLFVFVFF